jgi:hypothetical protein
LDRRRSLSGMAYRDSVYSENIMLRVAQKTVAVVDVRRQFAGIHKKGNFAVGSLYQNMIMTQLIEKTYLCVV